jgi:hypothetical protein
MNLILWINFVFGRGYAAGAGSNLENPPDEDAELAKNCDWYEVWPIKTK